MGVWQVTNGTKPHVGQWDPLKDMLWDGHQWVNFNMYLDYPQLFPSLAGKVSVVTHHRIQPVITSMPQAEAIKHWEKETQPQAQDPWEALKSMF